MSEADPHQISTITWLLQSGGIAPLILGLVLAGVGIGFVIRPNRIASVMLAFLSLLPAIMGLIVVYTTAAAYGEMSASTTMPKPSEFADLTGKAMGSSFCSLLGTILSVVIAMLAMLRSNKQAHSSDMVASEDSSLR